MTAPKFRIGLFARTFMLIAVLMLASLAAWVHVFFSIDLEPRAIQASHRISSAISLAQLSLDFSPPSQHPRLLNEIAAHDAIRIKPWRPIDQATPVETTDYWNKVSALVDAQLNKKTPLFWALNGEPGLWVGFKADQIQYWLALEREHINDTSDTEWISWVTAAILLSFIGAAIAVGYLNRPLNRLARNAQMMSRGQTPKPLPEKGAREIRALNRSFNRMVTDLQEAEADRNLMLAGISHDLRTPLARMRLEVEMSPMSEAQQVAIDQDLAQVECSLNQLLDYARPVSKPPCQAIDVAQAVQSAVQTSQLHTLKHECTITLGFTVHAKALIDPHDLNRCLTNLIENAKRYGHQKKIHAHAQSQPHSVSHIEVSVHIKDDRVLINIEDSGPGIRPQDVARLLRPFSRGESARTGGGGAGLGLAIVNRLMAGAGGTLELLPRQQGGLLAQLNLPLAQ
jgi:two-component system osmolarity sensor histidine kinase EnvZ